MAKQKAIEVEAAVRAVWLAMQGKLDDATIDDVFGNAFAPSHTHLAKAFGVEVSTVRHTWSQNGLPSVGARGVGSKTEYGATLKWLRERIEKTQDARGVTELTKAKKAAEVRIADAEARIKEKKAETTEGEFVRVAAVQSVLWGMLNVVRDAFLTIPRKWTPRFPSKFATEWTSELDNDIRGALTIIAEKPIEDFLERTDSDV